MLIYETSTCLISEKRPWSHREQLIPQSAPLQWQRDTGSRYKDVIIWTNFMDEIQITAAMHQISQFNLYHVCPSGSCRIWIYLTQTGPQLRTLMHSCLSFKNFIMCTSIRDKYVLSKVILVKFSLSGGRVKEGEWGRELGSESVQLTDYLWNCCIHRHLNRNLSEWKRSGLTAV